MSNGTNDYLTLEVIAGTAFRSTADTDELSQRVKDRLGFGSFNIPARLALARSLAIPALPSKVEARWAGLSRATYCLGRGLT